MHYLSAYQLSHALGKLWIFLCLWTKQCICMWLHTKFCDNMQICEHPTIYIYTCIYIHIHTYIHQSLSTHTYIYIYIHDEIYWFPTVYCTHIPSIHLHMCSVETFNMEAMSPASQQTLERLVDRLSSGQTIPPRSVRRQLSGILRMGESSRQLVLRLFAVIVFTTHIFCILDRC